MRAPTRLCLSVLLLTPLPRPAAAQDGRALLDQVARAMGGGERVLGVRTLVLEGAGENYNLGQNRSPDADLPVYAVTEHRRLVDFAGRRWRQEQVREPRFVTGNTAPQRQRSALDGEVAFDVGNDGVARRAAARAAADRAAELLHHPVGFLQAALAPGARVAEGARVDGFRTLRLTAAGKTYTMLVDAATLLPARVRREADHPMLGDVVLETELGDWRQVEGLRLPMRIVQRLDRWTLADIRLSAARVNADVGDLAAPAGVRAAEPPAPAVNVAVEEIAPGVWYLAGQSHHSVAIEMSDHLLLVEAPLSEARTLAVIGRARELRPGKPVRAVIATHHHFDHSGGIRAAISEGLAVIAHARSRAFFEALAGRRFSLAPDALARSGRAARVQPVAERHVLADGARTVEIHPIQGSAHAETLLMVYLPAERLLIEADVYSPPAPNATPGPAPFAANLVENIDRLGLRVDRVVPIHGRVVPVADLRAAAAAAPGR